jgi:hypothetical protein
VRQDRKGTREPLGLRVRRVSKGRPGLIAKCLVRLVHKALREKPDRLARQARRDHRAPPGHRDQKEIPAPLAQLARQARKVLRGQQVRPALLALLGLQARKGRRATQD